MAKNEIRYMGRVYTVLSEGQVHLATSLLGDTLEPDTMTIIVEATGADALVLTSFEADDPVELYHRGERLLLCYLQSVSRTGPRTYKLYATSGVGRLIRRAHRGGLYTGETVAEALPDIFGDIAYRCKTDLARRQLYGWLPYCKPSDASARDNLARILYTIGATVRVDRSGALMIVPLWDGYSSILGAERMGVDAASTADGLISEVSILEHQYLESDETEDLYEGPTADGYEVIFGEPMHHLEAEGFAIKECGANYAILGSGDGKLVGHKYLHITRTVSRTLRPGNGQSLEAVDDQTLVGTMASYTAANRLANYYKSGVAISAPVVYRGELPGARLLAREPYDNVDVGACLTTADITLSANLAAQCDMLVGFVPYPDLDEYYDDVVLLTESGAWTCPDGVTSVTVVLIGGGGGGDGGGGGGPGERGSGSGPGKGGAGGRAGAAGAVYRALLPVTAWTAYPVVIGAGGKGGSGGQHGTAYLGNNAQTPSTPGEAGAAGGETVFGPLRSSFGAATRDGWLDEVSGTVYAKPGKDGADGGDGGKSGSKGADAAWAGTTYSGGGAGTGSNPGGGGGASVGVDGRPGSGKVGNTYDGGHGGNAGGVWYTDTGTVFDHGLVAGADGISYGDAGSGGHGGGGGGQGGSGKISGLGGHGADGTKGGDGKPGCVLLYYRKPRGTVSGWGVTNRNQWRLDKYGRRCIV